MKRDNQPALQSRGRFEKVGGDQPLPGPYDPLMDQLSAVETLSVGRNGQPPLNARGERLLRYLRKRNARRFR